MTTIARRETSLSALHTGSTGCPPGVVRGGDGGDGGGGGTGSTGHGVGVGDGGW